ncbi:MAG TPA: hypothetical protein VFT65_14695 [Candidatus Angelobacter sp.]|nr:hypothetical protein [Candidatus Angelobacter sp.]
MADGKAKKRASKRETAGGQLSESSPNPHGESKILQMPIRTDQRRDTGRRNVAQIPNMVGGRLNPSVAHELVPMGGGRKNDPKQPELLQPQKPGNRDPYQSDSKEQKRRTFRDRT